MRTVGRNYLVENDCIVLFDEAIGQRNSDEQQASLLHDGSCGYIEQLGVLCAITDRFARICRDRSVTHIVIDTDTAIELFLQGILKPEDFEHAEEGGTDYQIDLPHIAVAGLTVTLCIRRCLYEDVELPAPETAEAYSLH